MSKFIDSLEKSYKIKLTDKQKAIAEHTDGPALVLSCAGSGKTTVNIIKCANLIIEHGINAENILSVTFSKAAAIEMRSRFKKMFSNIIEKSVKFSTIHSLAYTIVRNYSGRHEIKFQFIESEDSTVSKTSLIKELYRKINNRIINDDKLEELISRIGYCKNMLLTSEQFEKYDKDIKNFSAIYSEYESYKRQHDLIDFDDMLTLANDYLKKDKSLLNLYRKHFKYIIVDEAQDTSKVQYEIIEQLAYPNYNITLIGDDDQAIYSFRGACPEYLLDFPKKFSNAEIFYMDENFRSTKNIVKHANNIIKSNLNRYDKNIITNNQEGPAVELVELAEDTQFQYILKEIKQRDNLNDYAVLYRNNISSIAMADLLDRNNVPFYLRDFKSLFFKHWVTQDIIAFLNVVLNPKDVESYSRIYAKTENYIKRDAIRYVEEHCDDIVFDSLDKYYEGNWRMLSQVKKLRAGFERLNNLKPVQAIQHIESSLNYSKYIEKNAEKFGYSIDTLTEILNTLELIAEQTDSLEDFINRLEELQHKMSDSKFNKSKNAVTLSTIHSVKGLEFEQVYLVNLIDDIFPGREAIKSFQEGKFEDMEEERRIYYVAITRAKQKLTLFGIKRKSFKRVVYSRFLYESIKLIKPAEERNVDVKQVENEFRQKQRESVEGMTEGSRIFHRKFGEGTIVELDKESIAIRFNEEHYGVKKFLLKLTVNSGIITPIEE
ncbi:ATP-dependent helicase [Clostridium oryzae]|uniref:DNA 3'-5' helicase n=1 Tax=Clostridium oryzae TaxID=1450648 RepID=A0A1V4IRT0_9CLOT|nr:ATP-dependent helicase [Clostridium oryzae]OPJ62613.1 putative ATP-dependent DNA helicase YjcD [Clostridium oryzae]